MNTQLAMDQRFVARLIEIERGLTDWEVDFIESLSRRVETQTLTDRQRERAEAIANRLHVPVIRAADPDSQRSQDRAIGLTPPLAGCETPCQVQTRRTSSSGSSS